MRILFCPAHYVYDDSIEGSELAWAYNIADRIGRLFPSSVVITGKSTVRGNKYRIIEVTPSETRVNFGLTHAFTFNAKYTFAAFRALHSARFDVVHHVLPFSIGMTYNLAALRHGWATPFVIGPVQPPLAVRDSDLDPTDFKSHRPMQQPGVAPARIAVGNALREFLVDTVAPVAVGRLSRRTLTRAAAVVAVNDEARDCLVRVGVSPSRLAVISPGVDTKRFKPGHVPGREGRIEVVSVSQLIKRKNVDVIIRAFAEVAKTAPEMTLRIVGDGPQQEPLRSLANELGLGSSVSFAGFVAHEEVHREYGRADVFVNVSAAESFGTTCLEALAAGLPVISTKVGEFATAVENDRNGYLLNDPTPRELAAALRRLIDDPRLIREMAGRARLRARRKFDWETAIIPKYVELYERVIREHAIGSPRLSSRVRA